MSPRRCPATNGGALGQLVARFVFLQKGKNCIDHDDAKDSQPRVAMPSPGFMKLAAKERPAGDPEQDGEEVREMASKSAQ